MRHAFIITAYNEICFAYKKGVAKKSGAFAFVVKVKSII